ncbi:MAG: ATP-binding protein [Armatimonadota bacterium]
MKGSTERRADDWVWADDQADYESSRPYEFSIIRAEDNVRIMLLVLLLAAGLAAPQLVTNRLALFTGLIVGAFLSMWTRYEADWLLLRRLGSLGQGAVVVVIGDFAWLALVTVGTGGLASPFSALLLMPILFAVALFSRLRVAVMLVTALVVVAYVGMAGVGSFDMMNSWQLAGILVTVAALAWVAHGVCLVLERERRTSELVIRNMSEGVLLLDNGGRVVVANRQIERLTGVPPNAIVGQEAARVVENEALSGIAPILQDVARAVNGPANHVREVTVHGPETLDLRVTTTRCFGPIGENVGYVIICEDITSVKTVMRVKEKGLSMLSHEIQSPLTTLRVTATMLGVLADRLSHEKFGHIAEVVDCETQRLMWIAGELLNISALEAPDASLQLAPTDVGALVAKVRRVMKLKAEQKKLSIEGAVEGDLSSIPVDPERLESAVHRLCENAIKYTEPGGTVAIDARRVNEHVEIAVSDTGKGIPPDKIGMIFEKFAQLEDDGEREKDERGAGLGLYVVRRIVELHGGEIAVDSEPGRGSTFRLHIPAERGEASRGEAGTAKAPHPEEVPAAS